MNQRWAPAFTVVELIITIVVIGVLVTVAAIGYNGVQKTTAIRSAQSDLDALSADMQRIQLKDGSYPTSVPSSTSSSNAIDLTIKQAGTAQVYTSLTPVQNGMLFAQICQNLIDEGVGQGQNNGGETQPYVSGCGQWNYNSTQITGWVTKQWATPVTKEQLSSYAANFTTSDTYNKAHEPTLKEFYNQLITRHLRQGGSFPITSFWDYWANSGNGGVMQQPLGQPTLKKYYCAEAKSQRYSDIIWQVTEDADIQPGSC